MKKKNFLFSAMLSTLLLTVNVSAQHIECKNGKCFINLKKISPMKIQSFKIKNTSQLVAEKSNEPKAIKLEIIAFDHSTYVMQKNEKLEPIDNDIETIVFPPSEYIMTQAEIDLYYKQMNTHKKKMIERATTLPTSEYYCENKKKAVYNKELEAYQCTI